MNWLGEKLNIKSMEDWYKIQYHVSKFYFLFFIIFFDLFLLI